MNLGGKIYIQTVHTHIYTNTYTLSEKNDQKKDIRPATTII